MSGHSFCVYKGFPEKYIWTYPIEIVCFFFYRFQIATFLLLEIHPYYLPWHFRPIWFMAICPYFGHVAIKANDNVAKMLVNTGVFWQNNNNSAIWSRNSIDWSILGEIRDDIFSLVFIYKDAWPLMKYVWILRYMSGLDQSRAFNSNIWNCPDILVVGGGWFVNLF